MKKINKKHYECKECRMIYKNKILAERCETWCRKHKSCNMEIIKRAVKNKNGK